MGTTTEARKLGLLAGVGLLAVSLALAGCTGSGGDGAFFYEPAVHGSSGDTVESVEDGVAAAEAVVLGRVVRAESGPSELPILDPDTNEVTGTIAAPAGVVATVAVDEVVAGSTGPSNETIALLLPPGTVTETALPSGTILLMIRRNEGGWVPIAPGGFLTEDRGKIISPLDPISPDAPDREHAQGPAGYAQGRTLEQLAQEARSARP